MPPAMSTGLAQVTIAETDAESHSGAIFRLARSATSYEASHCSANAWSKRHSCGRNPFTSQNTALAFPFGSIALTRNPRFVATCENVPLPAPTSRKLRPLASLTHLLIRKKFFSGSQQLRSMCEFPFA